MEATGVIWRQPTANTDSKCKDLPIAIALSNSLQKLTNRASRAAVQRSAVTPTASNVVQVT